MDKIHFSAEFTPAFKIIFALVVNEMYTK